MNFTDAKLKNRSDVKFTRPYTRNKSYFHNNIELKNKTKNFFTIFAIFSVSSLIFAFNSGKWQTAKKNFRLIFNFILL